MINLLRQLALVPLLLVSFSSVLALVPSPPTKNNGHRLSSVPEHDSGVVVSRQGFFLKIAAAAGVTFLGTAIPMITTPAPAHAFENKISTQYDDRPKRKGPPPKDLGVGIRTDLLGGVEEYRGLKHCGTAPNCFVSTDNADDDPDHSIPSWTWPKNYGTAAAAATANDDISNNTNTNGSQQAFEQLAATITKYPPGQGNIDGGGFKIISNDPQKGYIYTQFQSLKNGYIDDVEFALIDGVAASSSVQVRSSSRIGYLDYGVNAKRLNYIAKELRAQGWDAPGVEYSSHQNYVIQNELQ